ncbi:MAG: DNA-binding protein [Armatimonadota bacterium]|nr:MAG: DNA-binding protein [Armatimonadota bacterium]
MRIQTGGLSRLHIVRLDTGEDVLESLRAAAEQAGIRHGLILSGVGSVSRYHVHVVKTTNIPPGNVFFQGEGPFDVLSITGLVMDGRVHAHITLSDTEKALGGHLEEGCRVLTFCIIILADTEGLELTDLDRMATR